MSRKFCATMIAPVFLFASIHGALAMDGADLVSKLDITAPKFNTGGCKSARDTMAQYNGHVAERVLEGVFMLAAFGGIFAIPGALSQNGQEEKIANYLLQNLQTECSPNIVSGISWKRPTKAKHPRKPGWHSLMKAATVRHATWRRPSPGIRSPWIKASRRRWSISAQCISMAMEYRPIRHAPSRFGARPPTKEVRPPKQVWGRPIMMEPGCRRITRRPLRCGMMRSRRANHQRRPISVKLFWKAEASPRTPRRRCRIFARRHGTEARWLNLNSAACMNPEQPYPKATLPHIAGIPLPKKRLYAGFSKTSATAGKIDAGAIAAARPRGGVFQVAIHELPITGKRSSVT